MILDVDREINLAIEKFNAHRPSAILYHNEGCCVVAREWFRALDNSFLIKESIFSGPTWIRLQWKWGPVKWPLFWCQIPYLKILDCGALASLSCEAFRQRGLRAFPVQLIQKFSLQDARHWRKRWEEKGFSSSWILGSLVYHEACAVLVEKNRVRIWDPTDNVWIRLSRRGGYATTVAVRFNAEGITVDTLVWEGLIASPNMWVKI